MEDFDSYFEIAADNNLVRVEIIGFSHPEANSEWDRSWLNVKIFLKGGSFSGNYNSSFMIADFERFKKDIEYLYNNLNSSANFYGYEGQLELLVNGDGLGHLTTICRGKDDSYNSAELKFEIEFDQTSIPVILRQLQDILDHYKTV